MINSIKKQIPNLFTLGNLACGVMAIYFCFQPESDDCTPPKTAGLLIILAAILDFFDGFIARLLKVSGELGKQLDSLADMVTFGVAPGFILLALGKSYQVDSPFLYAFLLIPIFSAYRLAKFNIDTRQSDQFIGVPTPANALLCVSLIFLRDNIEGTIFTANYAFAAFCIVTSLMLIAELPLIALKFKGGLKANLKKLALPLVSGILIAVFQWAAVPAIYILYILYSIILNFAEKNKQASI